MKLIDKYFPLYQKGLDRYEKEHPHWHVEILISIIKRSIKQLKYLIEDVPDPQINWNNPLVAVHHPIGWNWKKRGPHDTFAPGGHLYGNITPRNTATKERAKKTLAEIMVNQLNATVLGNATNWAWYEKLNNHYTPVLPIELSIELDGINNKQKRRDHFHKLTRPFSMGTNKAAFEPQTGKHRARILKRIGKKFLNARIDTGPIQISGSVNGRSFEGVLVFEIHPLVADYNLKKAYHPITIGFGFTTEMIGTEIVEKSPACWPKSDREKFWAGLLAGIEKLKEKLIPKVKHEESVIVPFHAKIKIPAEFWHPTKRTATMKLIADAHGQIGEIIQFGTGEPEKPQAAPTPIQKKCQVCRWIHDAAFTQIKVSKDKVISLGGVLPDIVAVVHRAHEHGLSALSTKDSELQKICGGYSHPAKAFDDLNHRDDYKVLFARKHGFIALCAASGINPE